MIKVKLQNIHDDCFAQKIMFQFMSKKQKHGTLFSLGGWKVSMIDDISSKSWFCIQDIKGVMGVSMIVGVSTLRKSYNLLTLMKSWQYNL